MGRIPQPIAPQARRYPYSPTPAAADYSDEVSEKDIEALKELVREKKELVREKSEPGDWETIDGPGW
jgi:hypothetical protein